MGYSFAPTPRRTVSEANINYYAVPFIHPARTMQEHDFIYMLDGEWTFGQNGEIYTLKKNQLLILGAGQSHTGLAPCTAGTRTMYFHVSAAADDTFSRLEEGIPPLLDVSENRDVKKLFYALVSAKTTGDGRRASVLFDLLLCELTKTERHAADDEIGQRILHIIRKYPERSPSNAELAAQCGVSVKTAEAKFKAICGVTIHQYILQYKIEQAATFLRHFPEMSVKEIAYNLGFYDEYHFSRRFKQATGYSPTAYRALYT